MSHDGGYWKPLKASDYMSRGAMSHGEGEITLLILAGTHYEALEYASRLKLYSWVYVRAPLTIRKYSELSRVVGIGSWKQRADVREIMLLIEERKMIFENVNIKRLR